MVRDATFSQAGQAPIGKTSACSRKTSYLQMTRFLRSGREFTLAIQLIQRESAAACHAIENKGFEIDMNSVPMFI
jgi:hypothetical protein